MGELSASTQIPEPRRISCKSCGGNIDLRGSNEVEMVVCRSCGAQLDLSEGDAKIIGQIKRSGVHLPLQIGMKGRLKGKNYEVIGRLRYRQDGLYIWDEFLLFSPEHGYAWLVYENNHFSLVRSTKIKPSTNPKDLSYRKTFDISGTTFTVFEVLSAEIIDVEGELTWVAKLGDTMDALDAINPPLIYSVEWSTKEMEYFMGEYVPQADVTSGFGLKEALNRPEGVAPCQPFVTSPTLATIIKSSLWFSLIFLGLLVWAWTFGSGKLVLSQDFTGTDVIQGFQIQPITITKTNTICRIKLHAGVDNAWAWYDVDIVKDQEGEVYDISEQISYYHGYEGGESWSEGSRYASQVFKIGEPGTYLLKISGTGGVGESLEEGFTGYNGFVRFYENIMITRYYWFGLVVASFIPLIFYYRKYHFEHERWASEEEDDEDDE